MNIFRSISLPPKVSPGEPVKADHHNSLIDALKSLIVLSHAFRVRSSSEIGVRSEEVGGTLLYLKRVSHGGGSSTIDPWQPEFFNTGEDPVVYKCRFNLGTVNNVAAGNWNDEFTLPSDDTIKFVVITITTGSGQVTGVSISIDTAPPTADVIAKDTPPVTHKIVLGAIGKSSAKMIVRTNLVILGTEVFRETRTAPATGQEPFSRWWRWSVQPA